MRTREVGRRSGGFLLLVLRVFITQEVVNRYERMIPQQTQRSLCDVFGVNVQTQEGCVH